MRRLSVATSLVLCGLLLAVAGCIAAPQPALHGYHHHRPHPHQRQRICLPNAGNFAEPMHPVIGTNGQPFLLPQSGLKAIINQPPQTP